MVWWFKVNQFSVQQEMCERLQNSDEHFETLIITEQEYLENVIENGKEIRWKGNLYDIKSVAINNGKAFIMAINDTVEENLIKRFAGFVIHTSKNQEKIPNTISQLIVLTYLSPYTAFLFQISKSEVEVTNTSLFSSKIFQSGVPSPPPELNS